MTKKVTRIYGHTLTIQTRALDCWVYYCDNDSLSDTFPSYDAALRSLHDYFWKKYRETAKASWRNNKWEKDRIGSRHIETVIHNNIKISVVQNHAGSWNIRLDDEINEKSYTFIDEAKKEAFEYYWPARINLQKFSDYFFTENIDPPSAPDKVLALGQPTAEAVTSETLATLDDDTIKSALKKEKGHITIHFYDLEFNHQNTEKVKSVTKNVYLNAKKLTLDLSGDDNISEFKVLAITKGSIIITITGFIKDLIVSKILIDRDENEKDDQFILNKVTLLERLKNLGIVTVTPEMFWKYLEEEGGLRASMSWLFTCRNITCGNLTTTKTDPQDANLDMYV